MKTSKLRIKGLLESMSKDTLAPIENVHQLRQELAHHYKDDDFLKGQTMGGLVRQSLQRIYESKGV